MAQSQEITVKPISKDSGDHLWNSIWVTAGSSDCTAVAKVEYDFVIVGGGTSGLVIANRLSENPNVQVPVIEAGENYLEDPKVKIPALYDSLKGSDADWGFKTVAQVSSHGQTEIPLSQGRALGGSSALNAHVFVLPSQTTINAWEKLGASEWNWDVMKPYYAKVHSLRLQDSELDAHLDVSWTDNSKAITSGPIQTSYIGVLGDPIPKAWYQTFQSMGLHMNGDSFSGTPLGAFSCLASIDPDIKERSYAASAYYSPVTNRSNLRVCTGVRVDRVFFDDE
ncbi:hypothetical protein MMC25_007053 [Agyrium rufum]|nr:hypothetical protein [Agyrium rufum]